jgi:hypothetical protein
MKKLLSQKKWVHTKLIKDEQGFLITNGGKQLQRWKEHFQEILKDHSGQIQPDINQD